MSWLRRGGRLVVGMAAAWQHFATRLAFGCSAAAAAAALSRRREQSHPGRGRLAVGSGSVWGPCAAACLQPRSVDCSVAAAGAAPVSAAHPPIQEVLDPQRYCRAPANAMIPPHLLARLTECESGARASCFVRNTSSTQGVHFLHDFCQSDRGLGQAMYYAERDPEDGLVRKVLVAWTMGAGTCGHFGVCHGGCVAALLDDAFGSAAHSYLRSAGGVGNAATAYLNVEYKKPACAPGPALCEVSIERVEGRKVSLAAKFMTLDTKRDNSDAEGVASPPLVVVAEGTALFVELRSTSSLKQRVASANATPEIVHGVA